MKDFCWGESEKNKKPNQNCSIQATNPRGKRENLHRKLIAFCSIFFCSLSPPFVVKVAESMTNYASERDDSNVIAFTLIFMIIIYMWRRERGEKQCITLEMRMWVKEWITQFGLCWLHWFIIIAVAVKVSERAAQSRLNGNPMWERKTQKTIRHHLVATLCVWSCTSFLPPKKENYLAPKTCKLFIKSQQRTYWRFK